MAMTNPDPMDDSLGVEAALAVEQRRAATYRLLAALYHQPTDWPPNLFDDLASGKGVGDSASAAGSDASTAA